ncbi:MAG: CoA-binding protein [Chloroflexi bacterium]|nr:CoA-binding protein [Chloroflexota bacterium]MDK1046044.1 CoA-binding protein [Anaerolineales bacterium]MCH8093119.1 CoA-binding protein [Chloroflexota bacterium]MCH8337657.1 CoA-binding protein [Chloroflexota bacterium]MCH8341373.1 CoA-binding protein [Chloroflexota bacterium]
MQSLRDLKLIFEQTKTIAVVGLSKNPARPSHSVPQYLKDRGYRIIPVNPMAEELLGQKSYPDVRAIPEAIDVVQIFRKPEEVPAIVEDAIAVGAKVIWMQLGLVHERAAKRARSAGLQVVMDRCMRATHRELNLGMPKSKK